MGKIPVILITGGKPYAYSTFKEAAFKANPNDLIYCGSDEYRVPDYAELKKIEDRLNHTSKFSNKRHALESKLKSLVSEAMRFENKLREV